MGKKFSDLNDLAAVANGDILAALDVSSGKTLAVTVAQLVAFFTEEMFSATLAEIDAACEGIGVATPKKKLLQINDWDLSSGVGKSITHGLSLSKIVNIGGIFFNDSYSLAVGIAPSAAAGVGDTAWGPYVFGITATKVELAMFIGTTLPTGDYNSDTGLRGYLVVDYID